MVASSVEPLLNASPRPIEEHTTATSQTLLVQILPKTLKDSGVLSRDYELKILELLT
jgi:hypothetical protein